MSNKDYTKDMVIYRDWQRVKKILETSVLCTIFGYSGPKTDYLARKLLLDSWNRSPKYRINYLEVIDTKPQPEISESWSEFLRHPSFNF